MDWAGSKTGDDLEECWVLWCYGVIDWMFVSFLPNLYVETLIPNMMVLEGGTYGRKIESNSFAHFCFSLTLK